MGKVDRLGLQGRKIISRVATKNRRKTWPSYLGEDGRIREKPMPRLPKVPMPSPTEYDKPRKTLVDLQKGDCRFPIGDGPFGFCALPAVEGVSYCHVHLSRCYATIDVKKLMPDAEVSPVPEKTMEDA